MKAAIFLSLLLLFSLSGIAQNDCKRVHVGKFILVSPESGTTLITRTPLFQIEKNDTLGVEVLYDIKWVDDCTYQLRGKKIIKGDPAWAGKPTDYVTVTILEVKENSFRVKTTSNFSDLVIEREIEILKVISAH
jgi:hypothetical protein